jgi:hypothetical protein
VTPAWSLLARLDGLISRLDQAQRAIAAEGQDSRLQKRIGADLGRRLSEHTDALKVRRRKIAATSTVPANAWGEVRSSTSARLLDECLLYLQAARSRGPDVAADLCEITDALFEELAKKAKSVVWKSFSVFATEDSFDVLTPIIRLRYPVSGVWDVPVSVHEFGHFLSGRLRHQQDDGTASLVFEGQKNLSVPPREATQTSSGAGPEEERFPEPAAGIEWRAWLDEIFADVFATYAAGPSFAFSCLLFRFDPNSAQDQTDRKHPSYAKRAYVILQSLRRLNNEKSTRGRFAPTIRLLDKSWRTACEATGKSSDLAEKDKAWLDSQVTMIYHMLKIDEGGLRFTDWEGAESKMPLLENPEGSPQEFSIVELLNTAWLCRLKENSNPERLNENFLRLASQKTQSYDR